MRLHRSLLLCLALGVAAVQAEDAPRPTPWA
jgi:hypothetical protein